MADPILVTDLTTGAIAGTGVFDLLMQSVQKHIAAEFDGGRIKQSDYSQVYLGGLQSVLTTSMEFLLRQDKTQAENALLEQGLLKSIEDTALVVSQKALVDTQELGADQDTALRTQEVLTEIQNTLVAEATKCKLQAEFDVLEQQVLKVTAETGVLNQKKVTETAQTNGANATADSVVGSQVALYGAQKDGFLRDAEQKAAKLYFDTWNTRRITDENTLFNEYNGLQDANILRIANTLLDGVGA